MERFNYKRLDGLLLPGADYFRALQSHALSLEKELYDLREARSKDGNRFYQADAKRIADDNHKLQQTIFTQDRQLIAKDQEIARLKQLVKELQSNQIVEEISAGNPNDHRRNRKRGADGKLLPEEISKQELEERCYKMIKGGKTAKEVSDKLGTLSPASVNVYKNNYLRRKKAMEKAKPKTSHIQEYYNMILEDDSLKRKATYI